jgi:hypothetical protein
MHNQAAFGKGAEGAIHLMLAKGSWVCSLCVEVHGKAAIYLQATTCGGTVAALFCGALFVVVISKTA